MTLLRDKAIVTLRVLKRGRLGTSVKALAKAIIRSAISIGNPSTWDIDFFVRKPYELLITFKGFCKLNLYKFGLDV